jgi:DHA2 family multidrug resistance protein-like MFS transporter
MPSLENPSGEGSERIRPIQTSDQDRPSTAVFAAAVGFVLLGAGPGPDLLLVASAVFSLGISPAVTLSTDLVISAVTPERAGAASGMTETSTELGGALGIALIGSVGMVVYRAALSPPASIPYPAPAAARETLGGALAVAKGMPGPTGAAARKLLTQGLRAAGLVSAVIVLVVALVGAAMSRSTGRQAGGLRRARR